MNRRLLLLSGALFLVGGAAVWACYGPRFDSIHFYSLTYDSPKHWLDFGRAPQELMIANWNNEIARGSTSYNSSFDSPDMPMSRWNDEFEARKKRLAKGRNLEVRGRFREALVHFRKYRESTAWKSFLRDRKEVYQQARWKFARGVREYLRCRFLMEVGETKQVAEARAELRRISVAEFLRPHVEYALANDGYYAVFQRYPKSPRAEPALIMAARSLLSGDSLPARTSADKAERILKLLLKHFPNTRFRANAHGWLGRCEIVRGRPDRAIALYGMQAHYDTDGHDRWRAFDSIAQVYAEAGRRGKETEARLRGWLANRDLYDRTCAGVALREVVSKLAVGEAKALQNAIRKDPELLEAYVGFRIEDTRLTPAQESNLATFATQAVSSMARPPASLLARIAQIDYNCGHYRMARRVALRALSRGSGDGRARYVLAGSLARLGLTKQAIREHERILRSKAPSYMRKASAEHLALLSEKHGDPVRAIALYKQLGYEDDVSYLADAKLTPRELARYVSSLPRGEHRYVMTYTLGMRYLRKGQYSLSRAAFARIPRVDRLRFGLTRPNYKELGERFYHDNPPPRRDPLTVVAKLERLSARIRQVRGSENKARATYDMAAYIYKERNLLFYSAGLWKGSRAILLALAWSDLFNDANDERALKVHSFEHECLAHSLDLCREILREYPKSSVVPKALYTGAVSAERLGNLNGWWRERKVPLLKEAIANLEKLRKRFPNDPLAKPAAKYAGEFREMLNDRY